MSWDPTDIPLCSSDFTFQQNSMAFEHAFMPYCLNNFAFRVYHYLSSSTILVSAAQFLLNFIIF